MLLFSEEPTHKVLALVVYILAAITDWYDGYVARRWGYITRFGKFLDPLADKVLTSAAFISFIYIGYAQAWMVWTIVVRDVIITALRSFAEWKGKPVDTSMFAKTKTFVQLLFIYLLLFTYVVRSVPEYSITLTTWSERFVTPTTIYFSMLIVTVLTVWTGIAYLINNWKILLELFSFHNAE